MERERRTARGICPSALLQSLGATIARTIRSMRTLLICHEDAALHREGMARWLASFSTLTGIVVLHDSWRAKWRRTRRELSRVGPARLADVVAFRAYYKLFIAHRDREWEASRLYSLRQRYSRLSTDTPVLHIESPNSASAQRFIEQCAPDISLALCKTILKPAVFSIPSRGTFVLHPGICPEYRNAHGCFWALVNRDLDKVAMTLLRIDAGVDTGPVYGYYSYPYDELTESHWIIQQRVVLDTLEPLQQKLMAIAAGGAKPIDTSGRPSAIWGQPRFSSYVKWKFRARRRKANESPRPALS